MKWAAAVLAIAAAPPPVPIAKPGPDALRLLAHPVPRCDRTTKPDEIVVCARDREAVRQKLPFAPPPDPGDPRQFSVSRERNGLIERADGQAICDSAVGPWAGDGCLARDMQRAHDQNPKNWPTLPLPKPADRPPL